MECRLLSDTSVGAGICGRSDFTKPFFPVSQYEKQEGAEKSHDSGDGEVERAYGLSAARADGCGGP